MKIFKLKKTIGKSFVYSSIALGATFASMPSHAVCSGICGLNLTATMQGTMTLQSQMMQNTQSIIAAVNMAAYNIIQAIGSSTESTVGVNEKEGNSNKELTQAQMNYEAAQKVSKNFAEAQEKFTAVDSQAYNKCVVLGQAQDVAKAQTSAATNAKINTYNRTKKNITTTNAEVDAKAVIDDYKSNYCSDEDVKVGRCEKAARKDLQSAPVRADIFLNPTANGTYSVEEQNASQAFTQMVSNPVPIQSLSPSLEKTPAGQKFLLEQMHATAQMSVAQHSLESIRAAHMPNQELDGASKAAGYSGNLSQKGLMMKFTHDKFADPEYAKNLQRQNENGLLKELNTQIAFSNWMGFKQYEQNERMEAIVAVQMMNQVRTQSEAELSSMRERAGRSR